MVKMRYCAQRGAAIFTPCMTSARYVAISSSQRVFLLLSASHCAAHAANADTGIVGVLFFAASFLALVGEPLRRPCRKRRHRHRRRAINLRRHELDQL